MADLRRGRRMTEPEVLQIVNERLPGERGVWRRVELFFADADPSNKRVRPHSLIVDIPHWGIPDSVKDIVRRQIDKAEGEYLGCVSFDLPNIQGEIYGGD